MTSPVLRIALLLLGSGFCSLVYQVAWLRLLRLIFGASTAASAAVLAIFMGGLGLGGLLLGARADRHRRPLALYGRLELGITALAAASPLLVLLVRRLYIAAGGAETLGEGPGTLLRLLLAALVLGVPTVLMGGTLPAVAKAVERASDTARRDLAILYGANTLGAVLGAVAATFFSLEALGIRRSIWAAGALNLVVAVLALGLAARLGDRPATHPATQKTDRPANEEGRAPLALVLPAAAVVGFAFLLMELVWYRMLGPILGGSSYTFGLILAVALAGIGAGGLLYGRRARKNRPTLAAFAGTCAAEALLLILPFAAGDGLAILTLLLRPAGDLGFGVLVTSWLLPTALVIFPPALVAGYQFPLLVALLGSGDREVGRQVGLVYGWNTFGAIAGSIAGGFGLIPLLTAPGAWRLVAVILLVVAAAALLTDTLRRSPHPRFRRKAVLLPLLLGGLAAFLTTVPGPTAAWRHNPIGAGRAAGEIHGFNDLHRHLEDRRRAVIWEAEGVESSVGLLGRDQYIFLINGKADGSALRDGPNMVMSVLVGAALQGAPEKALVIGLGSGVSAGWLAEVPTVERVDVVELEEAVVEVARRCASVNHNVLEHPKVALHIGDGREWLLTGEERYDLIFSQPSNPYRAGIASLFSQELYRAAEAHLTEDGLLLQWLQGYEVDPSVVRSAYATLRSVFPVVESWQVHENDLLLVASHHPLDHDRRRLAALVEMEPWRTALPEVWGVEGLEGFYTGFVGTPELATELAEGGAVNTDDHPHMEFGFVRNLGRQGLFHINDLRRRARQRGWDRPGGSAASPEPAVDWSVVAELRTAQAATWGDFPLPPEGLEGPLAQRIAARLAYRRGDIDRAGVLWRSQPAPPSSRLDRLLVAETLADTGAEEAPATIQALSADTPFEAHVFHARWHWRRQGEGELAAARLAAALALARRDPWLYPPVLSRALVLAEALATAGIPGSNGKSWGELLAEPFAVRLLDELRARTRVKIAATLGDAAGCAEALAYFEPHAPWEGPFLFTRFQCYQAAGHPLTEEAGADVQRFLDHAPPRLETGLMNAGGGR